MENFKILQAHKLASYVAILKYYFLIFIIIIILINVRFYNDYNFITAHENLTSNLVTDKWNQWLHYFMIITWSLIISLLFVAIAMWSAHSNNDNNEQLTLKCCLICVCVCLLVHLIKIQNPCKISFETYVYITPLIIIHDVMYSKYMHMTGMGCFELVNFVNHLSRSECDGDTV